MARAVTEEFERPEGRTLIDKGRKAVQKLSKRLEALEVVEVAVDLLKPNKYNPNRQDDREFQLLLRSMREEGFTTPIVVNKDNVIVDGEHRWRAANHLGMTAVPVVFVDMSAEQMKISTLRHNRATGSEDLELSVKVLRELEDLGALGAAMEALQLDDEYVNLLLQDETAPEGLAAEEFSTAWEPEPSVVKQTTATGWAKDNVTLAFGESARQDITPEAAAVVTKLNEEVEQADTEKERKELRREMQAKTCTIQVMFPGDHGILVRQVLEPNPAARLRAICEQYWRENGKGL